MEDSTRKDPMIRSEVILRALRESRNQRNQLAEIGRATGLKGWWLRLVHSRRLSTSDFS